MCRRILKEICVDTCVPPGYHLFVAGRCVLEYMYDRSPAKKKPKDVWWLFIHLSFLLVSFTHNFPIVPAFLFKLELPVFMKKATGIIPATVFGTALL
jgi:hypothetical protein